MRVEYRTLPQARKKHIFFGQAKFDRQDHAYSMIQRENSINACMRTLMFAHAHALVHNLSRPLFLTNIGPAKTGPVAPALLLKCLCHGSIELFERVSCRVRIRWESLEDEQEDDESLNVESEVCTSYCNVCPNG